MALVLRHTPPQNEDYHKVPGGYRRMMSALLKYQRADGLWGQLVNDPEFFAKVQAVDGMLYWDDDVDMGEDDVWDAIEEQGGFSKVKKSRG